MVEASVQPGAVVLLSGGLDSTTVLAIATSEGRSPTALSFDYGQRHSRELDCAREIARAAGIRQIVVPIGLDLIGGSALTDERIKVPLDQHDQGGRIPPTYVPARNLVFLSVAVGCAEAIGAEEVWIGANAIDYSGYPDCRPEFIEAFGEAVRRGTKSGLENGTPRIVAPLMSMTKAEIIVRGSEEGVDYSATWSCYSGGETACGRCDSCILRQKGFAEAGMVDPLPYELNASH